MSTTTWTRDKANTSSEWPARPVSTRGRRRREANPCAWSWTRGRSTFSIRKPRPPCAESELAGRSEAVKDLADLAEHAGHEVLECVGVLEPADADGGRSRRRGSTSRCPRGPRR